MSCTYTRHVYTSVNLYYLSCLKEILKIINGVYDMIVLSLSTYAEITALVILLCMCKAGTVI